MFMTGEERHLACVRSEFREGWFPKPFSPTRLVAAVRARMQMQRAALLEATPAHV
jgi:DNA-binding response OmpR family regulator